MSDDRLHTDLESFSTCDIKRAGMYRYAEDPTTEILCLGFALHGKPVDLWVPAWDLPNNVLDGIKLDPGATLYIQPHCPEYLIDWAASGRLFVAHNAGFERTMLNGHPGQFIGFPRTEIKQWMCTAAKARAHGLPGSLAQVTEALGTHPKDEVGRRSMLAVCQPKKPSKNSPATRWTPENAPDKFVNLYHYNIDDVKAEMGVDVAVPDLSPSERRVWELDQLINDRGVAVDLEAIANVQFLVKEYKRDMEERCLAQTGFKPTQRGKIAEWVRAQGYSIADLQAATIERAVKDERCPYAVKGILRLYSTYGMKAVSKFDAIEDAVCSDGRIRGMFIYHGGGPGRWSSIIVQLQNLMRPVIKDAAVAIDAFSARSLDWIRTLYV